MSKFLTIHALIPMTAALLNRDESGRAKTLQVGGVTRTRVSSQCAKRHWRQALSDRSDLPDGERSRRIFSNVVLPALTDAGVPEDAARHITHAMRSLVIGPPKDADDDNGDKKKGKGGRGGKPADPLIAVRKGPSCTDELATAQAIFLGTPEIDYLTRLALDAWHATGDREQAVERLIEVTNDKKESKELRDNIAALKNGAGRTSAMFGRFVTADLFSRVDGAICVAHPFTTGAGAVDDDYFTAVDDLAPDDGAGHLNTTEIASGELLVADVLDVNQLVSNLSGDVIAAASLVEALVLTIAETCLGAKRGSTAPFTSPDLVMVEATDSQPRTLAAAFVAPVRPTREGGWLEPTMERLADYLAREQRMWGQRRSECTYASMSDASLPGDRGTIHEVAAFAAAAVRSGREGV